MRANRLLGEFCNWNLIIKLNSVALVRELTIPRDRRLSAKLVPTFADTGYRVVSATDPHGRIIWFLDRRRYFFFQVAPQMYWRGWMDPVPDPLFLRKFGNVGNWTRTSGSVARNSDHWTTEAVAIRIYCGQNTTCGHFVNNGPFFKVWISHKS
jgi:hypothetical protein